MLSNHLSQLLELVDGMKSDKVSNYIIAGLESHLLNNGKVRLFKNTRDHIDGITPHNHRFDLLCIVLEGTVQNILFKADVEGDLYQVSDIYLKGDHGLYEKKESFTQHFSLESRTYHAGEVYFMKQDEIHSIRFSKNATVLFFEGCEKKDCSQVLEPIVDGEVVPTFEVRDYMFKREGE